MQIFHLEATYLWALQQVETRSSSSLDSTTDSQMTYSEAKHSDRDY